ncbi:ABC transporter permease subunit [Brevibacillus sp. B_LB10_24]|uniref:branched-chain amino acid ABC transporter ATP-binding protein/permease n=1 Tax=Brevibacillus sp. B_LB10_24 TaxID=3380645 RepID=UPI0038B9AD10
MQPMGNLAKIGILLLVVLAAVAPFLLPGGRLGAYYMTTMIKSVTFCIATLGLTVALGYAGQITLAQAAFFGLGSYSIAIACSLYGFPVWVGALLSILVPLLVGLFLGAVSLRLVTHYLALVTIGFQVIIQLVLHNWHSFTGGADGIRNIPRPFGLTNDTAYYWFGLVVLLAAVYLVFKMKHSRLGRALFALREDELAATACGIDLFKMKMLAFSISAGLAGLGGFLFAASYGYISPQTFVFEQSVMFFAMAIAGGAESIIGTMLGTILLTWLPEWLRAFKEYYLAVYGGLIIIVMVFVSDGIWGLLSRTYHRIRTGRQTKSDNVQQIKFPRGLELSFLRERQAKKAWDEHPVTAAALEKADTHRSVVLLEAVGLKKHFGGVKAVDGVDFQVRKGEIHVLIGPNGSGKTTVINVLSGLYSATGGQVRFKGKEMTNKKPHVIVQNGISRTFQNIRLFPELTVIDNVMIAAQVRSKSGLMGIVFGSKPARQEEERIRAKAEEALAFVGFTHFHEKVKNLSYGQQRMVEIARALATEPELLLLDEPAAGMNPEETKELVLLLKRLNELGLTLLLIEHDMDLVVEVADNLTVLDFGKKISEGSIDQVLNDAEVIKAYLGEEFAHAEAR